MGSGKNLGTDFKTSMRGDEILEETEAFLHGASIPETQRRPDLRMVVLNTTDADIKFVNPGGHSDQTEDIPPGKAAMLMVQGDTLLEQEHNAEILKARYGVGENRLQLALSDFNAGKLKGLVNEVYGPVSFDEQAARLVDTTWRAADGSTAVIHPIVTHNEAIGVRPAAEEEVFLVKGKPGDTLRGTDTVAEKFNREGLIAVAVSKGQDGKTRTRPIDIEVAKSYYGDAFNEIPVIDLDDQGRVEEVDLHPAKKSRMTNVTRNSAVLTPIMLPQAQSSYSAPMLS